MNGKDVFCLIAASFTVAVLVPPAVSSLSEDSEIGISADPNGYIVYCPCMGRFGNQADQFLGVLVFAKKLNRTLILPPWVEYRYGIGKTVMVPYKTYFRVDELTKYTRVIPMELFMETLADSVWPKGERKVFCYTGRHGAAQDDCNAKDGNPFGPFWDWFDIDFDSSEIFGPLFHDSQNSYMMDEWRDKYPASRYPVLAFVGAPSAFPVVREHVKLHRYVKWSDEYDQKANEFIKEKITLPFIGIHLRNGDDFRRACEHIKESPTMFAAEQCVGRGGRFGKTTPEMCFPSTETILKQVKKEIDQSGAKTLFIATDNDDLRKEFKKIIGDVSIVVQEYPSDPHLDLAVLGRADRFIGNCVSTFTAFVKRERDVNNLPLSFWAFTSKQKKEEL